MLGAVIGAAGRATSITFAAAISAACSAVAYSRFRRLALLSVLAGALVVTVAYPETYETGLVSAGQHHGPGGIRR